MHLNTIFTLNHNSKKGFTLVELAIVLVIIALVIGGALVGRDLIASSEIRAQISQIEKFNTAVYTFKTKYNGIPGDLKRTEAISLGFYAITYGPYLNNPGYGDNNGIINSRVAGTTSIAGEPFIFWRHLTEAGLVNGSYGEKLNTAAECTSGGTAIDFFPISSIGEGSVEANSPGNGINYFLIANFTAFGGCGAGGGVHSTNRNTLTAIESYQIDSKIDNGIPGTGNVITINGTTNLNAYVNWTTVSAVSGCVSAGAYALNPGTTKDCSLRIKFQ